jgi:hypothetical protein
MAHPALRGLMQSVVLLQTNRQVGTGLLVVRIEESPRRVAVYLVANKHVLGDSPEQRKAFGIVEAKVTKPDSSETITVTFRYKGYDGRNLLIEHPDPHVDVVALDVTRAVGEVLRQHPHIVGYVTHNSFATEQQVEDFEIGPGDDIQLVGFPLGLVGASGIRPIVRQGILASPPGESVAERDQHGALIHVPGFRIDAGVVPGGSGSPIILKPTTTRFNSDGTFVIGSRIPPLILGIAARSYTTQPEGTPFKLSTGLGLAVDFRAIRHVLNEAWQTVRWE